MTVPIIAVAATSSPAPPPTKAQLNLIRDSWERVLSIRHPDDVVTSPSAAFTQAFYDALFSLNKGMTKPFSNIQRQACCLTGIVSYIARAPSIMPARYNKLKKLREMARDEQNELNHDEERWMEGQLQALGARHAFAYNTLLSWLDHVGPALVTALQCRLDREFAPGEGDAWLQAHQYVVYHMKIGFKQQLEEGDDVMDDETRGNCVVQ